MSHLRAISRLLLLTWLGASAAACATGRAQAIEDRPALAVPPVPPRAIDPPPSVEAPPVEPLPEVALPPAVTAKPTTRQSTRNTADAKPEPKTESPPETTPAPASPAPVGALRTPTTPSGPDAARQIRESLDRAKAVLNRVDFRLLSDERKANYKVAQSFIEQGLDALKKEDLTLARSFAVRAEDIARQLEARR